MIQWLTDLLQDVASIRVDYDNGGFIFANKEAAFVRYNSGDSVWFKCVDGKWQVVGIDAHDDAVNYRA